MVRIRTVVKLTAFQARDLVHLQLIRPNYNYIARSLDERGIYRFVLLVLFVECIKRITNVLEANDLTSP